MELMYPAVVMIGIPVLVVLCAVLHVVPALTKKKYKNGIRTGTASIVKSLPIYKKIYLTKKILTYVNEAFVIAAIISALILIARPYKIQPIKTGVQKRDIFLCLDVSYSMFETNYELADYLEQVVGELKGDRFGVTIFNTSSVVYVPMTDDYDYVIMRLEELKEYFALQQEYINFFDEEGNFIGKTTEDSDRFYDVSARLSYVEAGTFVNSSYRGSSLIGEGLGSCLYSFPSIGDSARTRVIIFATDNEDMSNVEQVPELDEACKLCKKNDVTVFGIYPQKKKTDSDYTNQLRYDLKEDLKTQVEVTGGKLYVQTKDETVPKIVEKIRASEAMAVDDIVMKQKTDLPIPGIVALVLSIAGSLICMVFLKGK